MKRIREHPLQWIRLEVCLAVLALAFSDGCMPPSWGAAALLHPGRTMAVDARRPHETLSFEGVGVVLKAWRFRANGERRGTVVYLHGSGDNRGSSAYVADHFVPMGFDVVAYDSRAHGESSGDACTYGFHERHDLRRVLDQIDEAPLVVVLGVSLGGAVALQAAAEDARISAVIAVAAFSDLRTVAAERAPWFASRSNIEEALAIAEKQANFRVDDASPKLAAQRIKAPVLLIHGQRDDETPPAHSQRIFDELEHARHLHLVPEAGHSNALRGATWQVIDDWLARHIDTRD